MTVEILGGRYKGIIKEGKKIRAGEGRKGSNEV